jgi:hypothetical protein
MATVVVVTGVLPMVVEPASAAVPSASRAGVPGKPTKVKATVSGSTVKLTWKAPSRGGATVTDYRIECSINRGTSWKRVKDKVSAATSAKVKGLRTGVDLTCRVAAINGQGVGSMSKRSSFVTIPAAAKIPAAFTGSLSAVTVDDKDGFKDIRTELQATNVRFVRQQPFIPGSGQYRLVSGTMTISVTGTWLFLGETCSVDLSTTVDLASTTIDFKELNVFDSRLGGLGAPAGTGPVYYEIRTHGFLGLPQAPLSGPPGECDWNYTVPSALSIVGESPAFNPAGPEGDFRHSTSYTLTGSRVRTNIVQYDQTYTWTLTPAS